jgi:hypothetical protein
MQLPTHPHLKVVTSADARAALFLVECQRLFPVRRRYSTLPPPLSHLSKTFPDPCVYIFSYVDRMTLRKLGSPMAKSSFGSMAQRAKPVSRYVGPVPSSVWPPLVLLRWRARTHNE